jgi:hypothetical protein
MTEEIENLKAAIKQAQGLLEKMESTAFITRFTLSKPDEDYFMQSDWHLIGRSIDYPEDELWVAPEDAGVMPWGEAMKPPKPWMRLPTRDELCQMYVYYKLYGGGFRQVRYWSSAENYNINAWIQQFSDGAQHYDNKYDSYAVRYVATINRRQQ